MRPSPPSLTRPLARPRPHPYRLGTGEGTQDTATLTPAPGGVGTEATPYSVVYTGDPSQQRQIVAITCIGENGSSQASIPTIQPAPPSSIVPGVPRAATATSPQDAVVLLSWQTPLSNGGATITKCGLLRGC